MERVHPDAFLPSTVAFVPTCYLGIVRKRYLGTTSRVRPRLLPGKLFLTTSGRIKKKKIAMPFSFFRCLPKYDILATGAVPFNSTLTTTTKYIYVHTNYMKIVKTTTEPCFFTHDQQQRQIEELTEFEIDDNGGR